MKLIKIFGICIIVLTIFMTYINVVSAREFITQEQLESYSDLTIKTYLANNFKLSGAKDIYENKYTFYITTKTIVPKGNRYLITSYNSKAYLSKDDWNNCTSQYSFNVCKNNLILNYGTYGDSYSKTVMQQAKDSIIAEYKRILYYKNINNINVNGVGIEI